MINKRRLTAINRPAYNKLRTPARRHGPLYETLDSIPHKILIPLILDNDIVCFSSKTSNRQMFVRPRCCDNVFHNNFLS